MVGSRRKGLKQMLEFIIGLVIDAAAMYAAFKHTGDFKEW